jgi:hypothetical protein
MTNILNWDSVSDRNDMRPEFGACHVNYAWRRHQQNNHKFKNLENAFCSSNNSIIRLLQCRDGNVNAANHSDRGACIYVAIWYSDSDWAILCNPSSATLVQKSDLELLSITQQRNDEIINNLQVLFDSSSALHRELNSSFYSQHIT